MAQPNGQGYARAYTEEREAGPPAGYGAYPYGAPGYTAERRERPLGDMFQELAKDARDLIDLEITLAKTELSEKAGQAGRAASFVAAGGFVIYAGFLGILAAIIAVLAIFLPVWASALIVGVVVALIGYALLRKGMNDLKPANLTPQQTIETLKEDKEWVQNQVR